jgi:hypothetical protein
VRSELEQPGKGCLKSGAAHKAARVERPVRDVRDAEVSAEFQSRVEVVPHVEGVLYRGYGDVLAREANVLGRDLGQADVPDLALALEGLQRAELVLDRHLRVYAVQVTEIQPLTAQSAQARLDAGPEIARVAVRSPDVGRGADHADLRGDEHVIGVRIQGMPDEGFSRVRTIGVGGVDVRDAVGVDRLAQHGDRGGEVFGVAPGAGAGQTHGAESEPGDGLAGDGDGARGRFDAHTANAVAFTDVSGAQAPSP